MIGKLIDLHEASLYYIVTFLLLLGGSLAVVAIFFSVKGFQVAPYEYVVGKTVVAQPTVVALNHAPLDNNLAAAYNGARDNNRTSNNIRANNIRYSQWFFSTSMIIPPLILGIMLLSNLPSVGPAIKWQTIDAIDRGILTSQGQATGLANLATQVFLTADNATSVYECVNDTSHITIKHISSYGKMRGYEVNILPNNSQISFIVYLKGFALPSAATICPANNGTVQLASIMYFNVVLHIQQNGIDILTHSLGEVSRME